ncbi:hypothetical protein BT93_C0746 [Corymbia citriodora subsp. variegata]|nr:hypothetical protein BT93_C0746 [Corymbia citriodora subsp. variegata]
MADLADGVTCLGDAAGSPNLAVHGRRRHSQTFLRHDRQHCWLSRSDRPWSSAWLIPVMLLRSCKSCLFFFLLPTILCFLSFLFIFLVSFLVTRSVHGRLQPVTAVIAAT